MRFVWCPFDRVLFFFYTTFKHENIRDQYGLLIMAGMFAVSIFVPCYLYAENFYEAIYACFRAEYHFSMMSTTKNSLEFFNESNGDKYAQLNSMVNSWIVNVVAWLWNCMYIYPWYNTVLLFVVAASELMKKIRFIHIL